MAENILTKRREERRSVQTIDRQYFVGRTTAFSSSLLPSYNPRYLGRHEGKKQLPGRGQPTTISRHLKCFPPRSYLGTYGVLGHYQFGTAFPSRIAVKMEWFSTKLSDIMGTETAGRQTF